MNQKGMQMYTDCTFVPLRVKYNETRTDLIPGYASDSCLLRNASYKPQEFAKIFSVL